MGVPSLRRTQTIKAYPNPAKDKIFLSLPNEQPENSYTIYIYNMQGKCIYAKPLANNNKISTTEFANGLYMIKAVDNNTKQHYTTKIVIAK